MLAAKIVWLKNCTFNVWFLILVHIPSSFVFLCKMFWDQKWSVLYLFSLSNTVSMLWRSWHHVGRQTSSLGILSHVLPCSALLVHSSHAGYLTVPQTCQTHSCLRTFASAVSFFWNLFLQIDTICLFLKNSNCIFCKAFPGHPSYFTPAWPNPFIILLIFIIALSLFEFCVGMNLFTHVKSSSFRGTVVSK